MALEHVVITSVNRDELSDGGASIYAETISRIHDAVPGCSVEVLIPDFKGDEAALRVVMETKPAILGHNLETVEREFIRMCARAAVIGAPSLFSERPRGSTHPF